MFDIPIYSAELDIADKIKNGYSVAHLVEFKEATPICNKVLEHLKASENNGRKNWDLYYLQALLVTSVINENDDCFLPQELWAARHTVSDKPFNLEHKCDDIIGHTVGGYVIDDDGKIVPDDSAVDKLPDTLHIVATSVVYKYWSDEKKQEQMSQLLAEIKNGDWFVSVECLFPTFDYMLVGKEKFRLIARNDKTAYLTKYLRAYGGNGVYEGEQINRVPRNLILSGKGLVKKPANKQSIIFAKKLEIAKSNIIFENILQDFNNSNSSVYSKSEVNTMNDTDKVLFENQIKTLQAELAKKTDEYTQIKASIENGKHQEVVAKLEKVSKDLEVSVKDVEAKNQEIGSLKASIEKLNTDKSEVNKELEKINATKKELEDKLFKIDSEKKYAERIHATITKMKLTEENAKKFVDNLSKLDDATFADHVDFQSKIGITAAVATDTVIVPDPKALPTEGKIEKPGLNITQITASDKNKVICTQLQTMLDVGRKVTEKSKFARE